MVSVLFGQLQHGRLGRLDFLGYTVLLAFITVLLGLSVGMAIGVGEQLIAGDPRQAHALVREVLGAPQAFILMVLGAALLFAHFNITAKRLRDIGLPG